MADQPRVKRYVFAAENRGECVVAREVGTEMVTITINGQTATFSGRRLKELERALKQVQSDEEDDYER